MLVCLGLNHESAPVEIRERFAVPESQLPEQNQTLHTLSTPPVAENLILSTCNRTEYYTVIDPRESVPSNPVPALQDWLAQQTQTTDIHPHFYDHQGAAAARHLCRVVSGIDSMVLGETEIFGQVKKAYQAAHEAGTTSGILNKLFQQSFSIGKRVRNSTDIQRGQTSVGSVAVDLAEKIFGKLTDTKVMILGAGEMSRTTAQSLKSRGAQSIIVSNRSFDRAEELAAELDGRAIKFDDWEKSLAEVDVVISSTGAPRSIVHPAHIQAVRRTRKYRPLFMIDLAVPRDIDPAVGHIEEVYLYDIDTLQQLAEKGKENRQNQIITCEEIINTELTKLGY